MKSLLYLEFRQAVNYLRITLRSPKRLIPVLLTLLWVFMVAGPSAISNRHTRMSGALVPFHSRLDQLWVGVFAVLLVVGIYMIQKSFSEGIITFPMPDIDFLFPTPIMRSLVMAVKLLATYVKVGVYVLFLTIVFRPSIELFVGHAGAGSVITAWLGIWLYAILLINVCVVVSVAASYKGGSRWWLAEVTRYVIYCLVAFAAGRLLAGYIHGEDMLFAFISAMRSPVFLVFMLPVTWATNLALGLPEAKILGMLGGLSWLVVLAVISFVLVVLRKENPYEPSLVVSARVAAVRSAFRAGGLGRARMEVWKSRGKSRVGLAGIRPFGRGAMALVWKNLNVTWRSSGVRVLLLPVGIAATLLAVKALFKGRVGSQEVEQITMAGLAYMQYMFTIFMLQIFRGDMRQANILKPMPIPAWQLILVETINGTLIIGAITWITVGLVHCIFGLTPGSPLILIALALPFAVNGSLCWQVVTAILYPNWDDLSQRYLGGLIGTSVGILALMPPVVIGGILWYFHVPTWITLLITVPISVGISVAGIAVATRVYRRYDPTDE